MSNTQQRLQQIEVYLHDATNSVKQLREFTKHIETAYKATAEELEIKKQVIIEQEKTIVSLKQINLQIEHKYINIANNLKSQLHEEVQTKKELANQTEIIIKTLSREKDVSQQIITEQKQQILSLEQANKHLQQQYDYSSSKLDELRQIERRARHEEERNIEGIIVTSEGMVLGQRQSHDSTLQNNNLVFDGVTTINPTVAIRKEGTHYPFWLLELSGTPVLKPVTICSTTTGVTEPLLRKAVSKHIASCSNIHLLETVALPIRNRDYGYIPDIALFIADCNCYLDIEIDEPYDLITRKPIHHKNQSDQLRNLYFIENGWAVCRFSEQQIVEQMPAVLNTISQFITYLTGQHYAYSIDKIEIKSELRWDYQVALEMERNKIREQYLHINTLNKNNTIQPNRLFEGQKPAVDILRNQCEKYEKLLESTKGYPFTKITMRTSDTEYLLNTGTEKFTIIDFEQGWLIYDIIEQQEVFIPFSDIIMVTPLNKKWRYPVLERDGTLSYLNRLQKLLIEAMYGGYPIYVSYENRKGEKSERTILYLTYWLQNNETYENISYKDAYPVLYNTDYCNNKCDYFVGLCKKRNESRTFKSENIQNIALYDCHKRCFEFSSNQVWSCVEANYPQIAVYLYQSFQQQKQQNPDMQANYAYAIALLGKTEEALNILLQHKKDEQVFKSIKQSWQELVLEDLKILYRNSKQAELLQPLIKGLEIAGWDIPTSW